MKLSKIIEKAQNYIDIHGDIDCYLDCDPHDECLYEIEDMAVDTIVGEDVKAFVFTSYQVGQVTPLKIVK